ncbi:MAG: TPM domain-containing protein, partial [Bacteroidota bacterium]
MNQNKNIYKRLGIILGILLLPAIIWAQSIPAYQGFVNDYKNLLTPTQKQQLEVSLTNFASQTSNEIAVLISDLPDNADLSNYSYRVARGWGIGSKKDNNGVLLAIYLNVRQVDIEVGYGLEPTIPDIVAFNIIDQDIRPAFKNGQYF